MDFLWVTNSDSFNTQLDAGEIDQESVVFDAPNQRIWSHGIWFGDVGSRPTVEEVQNMINNSITIALNTET